MFRNKNMNYQLFRYMPVVLSVFLMGSCSSGGKKKSEMPEIPVVKISVADVARKDMQDTVEFYGDIRLRRDVRLASQFDGRLSGFSLLPGDKVSKGDRIGIITPPMREALLQVMDEIPPEKREMISREIKEVPLYSPINGTVLEVFRHTGDVVQKGEAIVHIGMLNLLDVYGDIPLKYLKQVSTLKKLTVNFVGYSHQPLDLRIAAIGGEMDMEKNTVPVRLRLDNSGNFFKPGMIVKLSYPGEVHKNVLVVPRSAVLSEEGIFSVFVVNNGNKVEKRIIEPGIIQDDYIEVLKGLNEGEKIATEKAYSLVDGMEVKIVTSTP